MAESMRSDFYLVAPHKEPVFVFSLLVGLFVCLPQGGVEQYEGVAESVRTTRWLLIRSPSLFHTSTADRGWVTVGENANWHFR